jgi:hypothetical protein
MYGWVHMSVLYTGRVIILSDVRLFSYIYKCYAIFMKKIIPTIIIIALAAWAVYYFTVRSTPSVPVGGNITATSSDMNRYSSDTFGISFYYPDGYELSEAERGTAERGHYSIVLVRDEDRVPPVNGEGPTSITIDIYENNIDKQTLVGWLNNSSASNFKLSNGTYATTSVASVPAVTYAWSGLYEGKTTAFVHGTNIIALSVTHMSPDDSNLGVYDIIRTSLTLFSPRTGTSSPATSTPR